MTTLNDQLRLEILAGTSGNAIGNHSAQDGTTTGWNALAGTGPAGKWSFAGSIAAASGLPFGYGGKAFRSRAVETSGPGSLGFAGIRGPAYPVAGLQWTDFAVTINAPADNVNGGRRVTLGIEWFNGSGAKLGATEWGTDYATEIPYNESATLAFGSKSGNGAYVSSGNGPNGTQLKAAPSGTVTARPYVYWSSTQQTGTPPPTMDTYISQLMVVTGSNQSSVTNPVFSDVPETWQNLLPKGMSITVNRGGDVAGVTDALDAALMTAIVRDPLITPDNNDRVRPGRPIRLLGYSAGTDWTPVFRGKIVQASTNYDGVEPVVTITAADAMAELANFLQPLGKSGTFKQRVNAAMLNVPGVPYTVSDAASNVAQATISADDSGTALSQLQLIRDSLRGLFYVDRSNTLRAFANASYPSQAPTITLSDTHADAGAIYYTGIETNFDSKNLVNSLTVTKNALSEEGGSKTYGPYVNQASVDAWGTVSANLTINDGDPATVAAAYLAVYAQPAIFTESVTFNATEDVAKALTRDLYEATRVKFAKANLNAVYRVIGIEHQITPLKWMVKLRFKPLESTSSIVVTNPAGGANTGPKDLVPFTREIQTGVVNITSTAVDTPRAAAVAFPKPYESPPRVFVTADLGFPFTRIREVTVNDITEGGCNVWLAEAATSGAARPIQWVAIPR